MPTYGPDSATCEVLTFKEGLLSPVAHDLLLRATDFRIAIDHATRAVSARFDAASLRVVTAMRAGQPFPGALRPADAQEIEAIIVREVLRARHHPEIRFDSREVSPVESGYRVTGGLTMAGATREVALVVRRDAGKLVTEVRIHQTDFGIRPYRAMLGALRVRGEVVVRAAVPSEEPS